MAHLKSGSFIRRAKDITVGSTLALALFSGGILMEGCGSSQEDEAYSYEETTYKKGIRSHISEVKAGEFKITNEESVPGEKSEAIVSYLDGHSDTLSAAAAKALIDEEIRTNPGYVGHHSGLSSMLLYGGLGYMLGRNNNNGYINNYRDRNPSGTSAFYANPGAYSRSQSAVQDVHASRSTRTVTSRPRGGRSGFFSRSSGRSGG